MNARQPALAVMASGVCTQAGEAPFAALAAAMLKLSGGRADPILSFPGPDGRPAQALSAPIEPVEGDGEPTSRFTALLERAFDSLFAELAPEQLGADCLLQVLLPPLGTQRGAAVSADVLRESLCELHPALSSVTWSFARVNEGVMPHLRRIDGELREGKWRLALLAGVDSLVDSVSCIELARTGRLMTAGATQGLIPGEAAAVLAFRLSGAHGCKATLAGLGESQSGNPGRALSEAIEQALAQAGLTPEAVRRVSVNLGAEPADALEWHAVTGRLWRARLSERERHAQELGLLERADVAAPELALLKPFQAFGETGAAAFVLQLALASTGFDYARRFARFGFEPAQPTLVCETSDRAARGAVCLLPA